MGLALSVAASPLAQAACIADVAVANWWTERDGFVQKARMEGVVQGDSWGGPVEIHFGARFHYERADGWAGTEWGRGKIWIDTAETASGNGLVGAVVALCGAGRPCWVNDVEVHDVSCID